MKKRLNQLLRYARSLIEPKAMIFGIALLLWIAMEVWVWRWYQRLGGHPSDWYPDPLLNIPYLLVFASAMLLLNRWWSHSLALIVSGWVIYFLGYTDVYYLSIANDHPFFSFYILRMWFNMKYAGQPQELLQLALAFVILSYTVCAVSRYGWRRWR